MILVTGATGNTGGEVLARLVELGAPVRALARDPEKAEVLAATGVDVALGDMTDPVAMAAALAGVERLFLMSPPHPAQHEMEGAVLDAALDAGVSLVVKLSALGAGPESPLQLGQRHAEIEERLAGSGVSHTVLRPGSFMQNFFNFAPTIRADDTFYAPAGDGAIAMVDSRDIAAVAGAVLSEGGHDGDVLTITGPEAVTYEEAAEALSAATGRTIRYVDVPPEAAGQGMLEAGIPDWLVDDLLVLYGLQRDGYAAEITPTVKEVARVEPHTFAHFARDYAPVFAA
jgi:uncharacterized protein YbjT (DUF2867 family)